jgi:ribosomal protein S18 acetylase RimI-like enzyme
MTTIRSATTTELAAVVDLWKRAGGPTSHAPELSDAVALLDRDPDALIVAVDDGQIVGTLIVGWDGWRCHLYRLAVDHNARRRGIATELFAEARDRAIATGAFRFDATVDGDNADAHGFWSSVGFEMEHQNQRWLLPL